MSIYVLHHADADGRFSAYSAWSYFKQLGIGHLEQVIFHEVQYGKPFPLNVETLTKEDEVYILDFSYQRVILDPVFERVGKLVVLDHHESSKEDLVGAPYGFFDLTKSGALLAWEYFFPNEPPPLACLLVNDRDLWQWKMEPHTSAFEAWLHHDKVGQNWEKWDALTNNQAAMAEALEKGALLHQHSLSIVDAFTRNPDNYRISEAYLEQADKNHARKARFAIYNGNQVLISEIAQALYTTHQIDCTIDWRCRGDIITFSVRAPNPKVFSAKEFCVSHAGGGHPAASGFSLPRTEAFELINKLMDGNYR